MRYVWLLFLTGCTCVHPEFAELQKTTLQLQDEISRLKVAFSELEADVALERSTPKE